MIDEFDDLDFNERPSKSQRKREMTALQEQGQKLLKLNNQQLKSLNLPEILLEAITLAQRLNKHEAIRRQVQYIGRLMRETDEDTLARIKHYLEVRKR